MSRLIDLTGQRFGEWLVLSRAGHSSKPVMWNCKCSCGFEKKVSSQDLREGQSTSCKECRKKQKSNNYKHGASVPNSTNYKEFCVWASAKSRCYNPHNNRYHNYGGRGITMCDSWINDFPAFLNDMGKCPKGMTLERLDVNGNYEPNNCMWATVREQLRNKTNNHWLEYKGKKLILEDWAARFGTRPGTLLRWLQRNKTGIEGWIKAHPNALEGKVYE